MVEDPIDEQQEEMFYVDSPPPDYDTLYDDNNGESSSSTTPRSPHSQHHIQIQPPQWYRLQELGRASPSQPVERADTVLHVDSNSYDHTPSLNVHTSGSTDSSYNSSSEELGGPLASSSNEIVSHQEEKEVDMIDPLPQPSVIVGRSNSKGKEREIPLYIKELGAAEPTMDSKGKQPDADYDYDENCEHQEHVIVMPALHDKDIDDQLQHPLAII